VATHTSACGHWISPMKSNVSAIPLGTLPELHGLEALAEIKAEPDLMIIPVVILSSSRNPGDIRRSYELHANAYVVRVQPGWWRQS
jgi:DNA-binding NarL/FixJ family response regulator